MEDRRLTNVLFNLGGPDKPDSVQAFLFNLFNGKVIINLLLPMRFLLAEFILARRVPIAHEIYECIRGGSPVLANSEAWAGAPGGALHDLGEVHCFMAMRYRHPMTEAAVTAVKDVDPARIVLLPLHPQFLTKTRGSSSSTWRKAVTAIGLTFPTRTVRFYPTEEGFIVKSQGRIRAELTVLKGDTLIRMLHSAHGSLKKSVDGDEPYQSQVEVMVRGIGAGVSNSRVENVVCFQSRVGPLEWTGPAIEDRIARAGDDGCSVVISPLAFISEYSEASVELGIEYGEVAAEKGVLRYRQVPTPGVGRSFIGGLARTVSGVLAGAPHLAAAGGRRICAAIWGRCFSYLEVPANG